MAYRRSCTLLPEPRSPSDAKYPWSAQGRDGLGGAEVGRRGLDGIGGPVALRSKLRLGVGLRGLGWRGLGVGCGLDNCWLLERRGLG
eukprot:scaffold85360_cov23-Tisochrysis_lutea.AAC.3